MIGIYSNITLNDKSLSFFLLHHYSASCYLEILFDRRHAVHVLYYHCLGYGARAHLI
jgi:hypothetical protein